MAALPKPIRKNLKKETLKIKKLEKTGERPKGKSKAFESWAKEMYKHDQKIKKATKK